MMRGENSRSYCMTDRGRDRLLTLLEMDCPYTIQGYTIGEAATAL